MKRLHCDICDICIMPIPIQLPDEEKPIHVHPVVIHTRLESTAFHGEEIAICIHCMNKMIIARGL